jgi:hypothetical protein
MKLREIKQEVYRLTCTANTKDLRRQRPDLSRGRDLRCKSQWEAMLEIIIDLRDKGQDFSINDLDESERTLKESLFKVGRLAGMSNEKIELDWQRIQLDSQYAMQFNEFNIHIEDL